MSRRTILISAGGTATAWHLASLIASDFRDHYRLLVCDINPRHLVPAAVLADGFFQVPPSGAAGYRDAMLALLRAEGVSVFVTLIDEDCYAFPVDDPDLRALGVVSTGVEAGTAAILRDKGVLAAHLREAGLPVPRDYALADLEAASDAQAFFVKPRAGFGSRGVYRADRPAALAAAVQPGLLVQALCTGPEVTVEVYQDHGTVEALCRERIETKAGVCTKARVWADAELAELARRVCATLRLPAAFCFQVMRDAHGDWVITDLNPRLGAGTALATKAGWSLAAGALIRWGGLPLEARDFMRLPTRAMFVLRVFSEVVTEEDAPACR